VLDWCEFDRSDAIITADSRQRVHTSCATLQCSACTATAAAACHVENSEMRRTGQGRRPCGPAGLREKGGPQISTRTSKESSWSRAAGCIRSRAACSRPRADSCSAGCRRSGERAPSTVERAGRRSAGRGSAGGGSAGRGSAGRGPVEHPLLASGEWILDEAARPLSNGPSGRSRASACSRAGTCGRHRNRSAGPGRNRPPADRSPPALGGRQRSSHAPEPRCASRSR
jgi:hypothetical protein